MKKPLTPFIVEILTDFAKAEPGEHLSTEELDLYATGMLPPESSPRVDDHLGRCPACCELVERLWRAIELEHSESTTVGPEANAALLAQWERLKAVCAGSLTKAKDVLQAIGRSYPSAFIQEASVMGASERRSEKAKPGKAVRIAAKRKEWPTTRVSFHMTQLKETSRGWLSRFAILRGDTCPAFAVITWYRYSSSLAQLCEHRISFQNRENTVTISLPRLLADEEWLFEVVPEQPKNPFHGI